MVICFDSTPEAKKALDILMATGEFRDVSEALSVALVNFEVIQRAVLQGNQICTETTTQLKAPQSSENTGGLKRTTSYAPEVPDLFYLKSAALDGLNLKEVPPSPAEPLPPARWLFGQYNKLLPVKAACRGLLGLLRTNPNGVPLLEATKAISLAAWELGDYLYTLDDKSKQPREEAFAAAFPTTAGNGAVSRIRFANQFVGDLRQPKRPDDQLRESKFNGLPAALKFIVCSEGRNPTLELTKPGAEFAVLHNPVLDHGAEAPVRKFDEAEIKFLLNHFRNAIPEEAAAYNSILEAILEGANTPGTVDSFLCSRFRLRITVKAEKENEITQTFLTTQRTGAISRMADVGLVSRQKAGLRVTYSVTNTGRMFHDQLAMNATAQ